MKLNKDKLVNQHGYFEGAVDAVDKESSSRAIDYKKSVIKNFITISPEQIDFRIAGEEFYVTRKYDGELNVIFYDNGECCVINRSGRVRSGLTCTEEAGRLLKDAGIKQAIIPAEMYCDETESRTRVGNVLKAYADEELTKTLCLAPFDILEIDGGVFRAQSYGETHARLKEIFKDGICHPVRCQKASSKKEIKEIYAQWVGTEEAEGLVVRTDSPLVYKVKPRHTIDVAVIGFSEGIGDAKGQVRSLLIAMMGEEGKYQIVGRTGNGMSDELRVDLLKRLTPMILPSKYIETDANHVAFHMVKPEIVIEIIVNDVIFDTTSGHSMNTVVQVKNGEYVRYREVEGFSFIYPIFTRFREDKSVNPLDVRLDQISSFAALPEQPVDQTMDAAESTLLHREVYKKAQGNKLMVQKYMIWKTNKENFPDYPAYVLHYTNFSSDRKEPLQREVRISCEENQLKELMDKMILENVKKGWEKV